MTGIGTAVNVAAILAGGSLGLLFRGGLKERYQQAVVRMLGVFTLIIGAAGALEGLLAAEGDRLQMGDPLPLVVALVSGVLAGEWLDLDGRLERFGVWLKEKTSRGEDNRFVEGFVAASLVVSVGAMAIVGALQDALAGDPSILYTKSILDFLIVMMLASTYGRGAVFSALPVGIFQGGVTLCAGVLAPAFTPQVLDSLSLTGGVLIFCVGANLAFNARFRVANMLPALVVGGVWAALL